MTSGWALHAHRLSISCSTHEYTRTCAPVPHFCGVRGHGAVSSFRHGCAAAQNKIDKKRGSLATWRPHPHDYAHAHPQCDLTPIARPHHGRQERYPATLSCEVVICELCSCVKLYIEHSREKHGCFMGTSWRVELPMLCMGLYQVSPPCLFLSPGRAFSLGFRFLLPIHLLHFQLLLDIRLDSLFNEREP